ncbi:ankyrin repeat domain-containing protein [Fangia hongkongensis]|uniref:ankyrin repeat domain-containing protein n=1 Tax=Fangia hongkongensis TaxID=270495 RepID=UPI00035F1251|nr:ankyrin repeat domain-containing protein [Fangia hongkongensis]MBK2124685.1 ankyrin repeat domain-containing protein [Fangia hongkongensis]
MNNKYTCLHKNIKKLSALENFQNYYDFLGKDEGYCYGLSACWGQAALCNELSTYYERLDYLTRDYKLHPVSFMRKSFTSLTELIEAYCDAKKLCRNNLITSQLYYKNELGRLEILDSINAFLQTLIVYHTPCSLQISPKHISQNIEAFSTLVANKKIHAYNANNSNTLTPQISEYASVVFWGDKKAYATLFSAIKLLPVIKNNAYFISVSGYGHSIGLRKHQYHWQVYDANFMTENIYIKPLFSDDALVNQLYQSFAVTSKEISLSIKLYVMAKDNQQAADTRDLILLAYHYLNINTKLQHYIQKHRPFCWNKEYVARAMLLSQQLKSERSLQKVLSLLEQEEQFCISHRNIVSGNKDTKTFWLGSNYFLLLNSLKCQSEASLSKDEQKIYAATFLHERLYAKQKMCPHYFYLLCAEGKLGVIKACFDQRYFDLKSMCTEQYSPLVIACQNSHTNTALFLIEKLPYEMVNRPNSSGVHAFWSACQSGAAKLVQAMVHDPKVSTTTLFKNTNALYIACQNGHDKVVEILIKHTSLFLHPQKHEMLLFLACQGEHEKVVATLLKYVDRYCINEYVTLHTPLMVACKKGNLAIVTMLLLCRETDINEINLLGDSAFSIAAKEGYQDIMRLFIKTRKLDKKTIARTVYQACKEYNHNALKVLIQYYGKWLHQKEYYHYLTLEQIKQVRAIVKHCKIA